MTGTLNSHLEVAKRVICLHQIQLAGRTASLNKTNQQGIGQDMWKALEDMKKTDLLLKTYEPTEFAVDKMIQLISIHSQLVPKHEYQQPRTSHLKVETLKFVAKIGLSALMESAGKTYEAMNRTIQSMATEEGERIRDKLKEDQTSTKSREDVFRDYIIACSLEGQDTIRLIDLAITEASRIIDVKNIPMLNTETCVFCYKEEHTRDKCPESIFEKIKRTLTLKICLLCLKTDHTISECAQRAKCEGCQGPHHHSLCSKAPYVAEVIGYVEPADRKPCAYCYDNHTARHCKLQRATKTCLTSVMEVCYRCLSETHEGEYCDRTCKICGRDHHDLHCMKPEEARRTVMFTKIAKGNINEYKTLIEKEEAEGRYQIIETFLRKWAPWYRKPCQYCDDWNHRAETCGIPVSDKQLAVLEKNLCNRCLSHQHATKDCRLVNKCKHCKQDHYDRHCSQATADPDPCEQSSGNQTRPEVRDPEMKSGDRTMTKSQTTGAETTRQTVQSENHGNGERPVVKLTELTLYDSEVDKNPYMIVTWFTHEDGFQNLEAYIHHHQHDLNSMRKLFSIGKLKRNDTVTKDFDICVNLIIQNLKEIIQEIGRSPTDVVIIHKIPNGQRDVPKNRDKIRTELQGIQTWIWKWTSTPVHKNREGCKLRFAKNIVQSWTEASMRKAEKEQKKSSKSQAGSEGPRRRGPQKIRCTSNKSEGQSVSQERYDDLQGSQHQEGPQ